MQLTIRMPDDYKKKIEILSDNIGLKRSDIARLALRKFIDEHFSRASDFQSQYQFL